MFSTMKFVGFLLVVFLETRPGFSEMYGQIQDINFINDLGENMMTDPLGTVQAYYDHAAPFAYKSSLGYHLLTAVRAFNLSLIDTRLMLNQTQEHFKVVFDKHLQNTSPLLKTSLVVCMNSFLQAIHKLNNFLSNANSTVNGAMVNSKPGGEKALSRALQAVAELQNCSDSNNLVSDVNFTDELNLCIAKEIITFTLEFNKFILHLNRFKAFYPDAVLETADCLLTNANLTEIRPVLEMARCLGAMQTKRLTEFYEILNIGNVLMNNLVQSIMRMSTKLNTCRVDTVESFKAFLVKNNVTCGSPTV